MKRSFALFLLLLTGCTSFSAQVQPIIETSPTPSAPKQNPKATPTEKLIAAAIEQVNVTTEYDPAYVKLAYPNGDVPIKTGVCADVIVRAFRKVGVDLQKELHEDMKQNFAKYPKKWGAKSTDSNIDHRRVPNLMTWFERKGKALPFSDYQPGDIVAWDLGGGLTHIGFVSAEKANQQYKIIHNIGAGTQIEDRLLDWKVIGHYRYFGVAATESITELAPAAPSKKPKRVRQ
jgi:uncharacterized protein